jgi:hypothetical protein
VSALRFLKWDEDKTHILSEDLYSAFGYLIFNIRIKLIFSLQILRQIKCV